MSTPAVSITLEVDPSPSEKIVITLSKTTTPPDTDVWKMTFLLQEGTPLATVVSLAVEIDSDNNPQAEATFNSGGLDDMQQGQAKIAGLVAQSPGASDDDKAFAAQQIIAVRQVPQQALTAANP